MNDIMEKIEVLELAAAKIVKGDKELGYEIIKEGYAFTPFKTFHRSYTLRDKMKQFQKDGFIDRYTGKKLVNPGILKVFSVYYPDIFPYHQHGKMTEGHIAYWDFFLSIVQNDSELMRDAYIKNWYDAVTTPAEFTNVLSGFCQKT